MTAINLFSPLAAQADAATVFAALGGAFFAVAILFLVWLVLSAFFIHLAAHVMGFPASMGTAMRAVLWQVVFCFILAIVFGLASAVFPPAALVAPIFIQWVGATLGIRQAYRVEFFRALIAAFLSGLFAWVAIVLLAIVVMLLMGASLQQMRDKIEAEKQPTTSVEWFDGRGNRGGAGDVTHSMPARYLLLQA